MSPVHAAVGEIIDAGGRTAQSFGLNRLLGQIYVYLYLSADPRSLDEIVEQLGVSKASASIACRQLESWSAVRRIWKKGDRKDYYCAETDVGNLVNGGLLASVNKKIESARVQIARSLALLDSDGAGNSAQVAFLKKRLREAESRRARIAGVLNNPLIRKLF
jgi:DNA-binding transcriptional regulator GbsR (MarR family)